VLKNEQPFLPVAALAALLAVSCSPSTGGPTPASPSSRAPSGGASVASCVPTWQLTQAPVPSGDSAAGTDLAGVVAVSSTDVWAVGSTSSTGGAQQTLVEHWGGSSWSTVPTPEPVDAASLGGTQLTAVSAVSADDVWAVGYIGSLTPPPTTTGVPPTAIAAQTLSEHWDGRTWSIVGLPDIAARDGVTPWDVLTAVVAISQDDVWAVGVTEWDLGDGIPVAQPLVEHWNGAYWSLVDVPDPEPLPPDWALAHDPVPAGTSGAVGSAALLGITASSVDDVWAVGGYEDDRGAETGNVSPWATLTEHWDGSSWSIVPAPDATLPEPLSGGSTQPDDLLSAASESPAGDLWAVGGALPGAALSLRRSGAAWSLVPSLAVTASGVSGWPGYWAPGSNDPTFLPGTIPLVGVITLSSTDAWAVGAVILHWNGASWQALYTVNGHSFGYLTGVGALRSGGLWAVGGTTIVHATCA
jgi:hypothetical protein